MGNNHDKYFGSDKRKIIVLGLQGSGKSTLLEYIKTEKFKIDVAKTKNLNIQDITIGNLSDLAGGQRQRVFWKQQYEGTQGVIFMIDAVVQNKQIVYAEIDKLVKNFEGGVPISICISKIDKVQSIQWGKLKVYLSKYFQETYKMKSIRVWQIDYNNKDSVKSMLSWFLNETKPI